MLSKYIPRPADRTGPHTAVMRLVPGPPPRPPGAARSLCPGLPLRPEGPPILSAKVDAKKSKGVIKILNFFVRGSRYQPTGTLPWSAQIFQHKGEGTFFLVIPNTACFKSSHYAAYLHKISHNITFPAKWGTTEEASLRWTGDAQLIVQN